MHYAEIAPQPSLADRVECLWSLTGDGAAGEPTRVFPDGCIELIVHIGTPWSWRPEGGEFVVQPRAFVVGQLTRPLWLRSPERGGHAFGARLRPGGALGIAGNALDALADTVTPLGAHWGECVADTLVRRLQDAGDDLARAAVNP